MKKIWSAVFLTLAVFSSLASAISVRSLGLGDIFSPAARDPSGLYYNPAYLARADAVRFSFDNIYGPTLPRNNLALSIGDLGLARSSTDQGAVYSLSQGLNTYSFLRLGFGVKFLDGKKDFDIGLDADINKNISFSTALLNEEGAFLPRKVSTTLALKTEDGDKSLAVNYDGSFRLGYENQITPKAFWRVGYNTDHPTAGFTVPIGQYVDLDFAADLLVGGSKGAFGLSLFRNTENKRTNSNHSINFGPVIVGEDRFITIEGYNIHYVDTGDPRGDGSRQRVRVLVLIGGGIHFTHHWDPYMAEFAKRYHVISIDQLGAGESDKPNYFFNYTIEEQAEIINELLRTIGVKEAYLFGYSYGGSIAFYLAGQYPEKYKKVVAIEGFVNGINTIPISDRLRLGVRNMRHDIEYLNAFLVKDLVTAHYRLLYPYFTSKMWYELNKATLYVDLRDKIKDLKAPVLYYAGTKSWAYEFLGPTKEFIKTNLKNLKYIELEGAGHDVDRFDESSFLNEVIEFLSQ